MKYTQEEKKLLKEFTNVRKENGIGLKNLTSEHLMAAKKWAKLTDYNIPKEDVKTLFKLANQLMEKENI